MSNLQRIAIIRIKGKPGLKKSVKDTFDILRLYKKNHVVVVSSSPTYAGMLTKIQDAVTWGEIDQETFKLLLEKRGKLPGKEPLTEKYLKEKCNLSFDQFAKEFIECKKELKEVPGLKPFFKLNPPVHGFERKGIKEQFSMGGVLGYRKEKINELLRRMM